MTRVSLKICLRGMARLWWGILLASLLGFLVLNVYGWRTYDEGYRTAMAFLMENDSTAGLAVKASSCETVAGSAQVRAAVEKAVSFPISDQDYQKAVKAVRDDEDAVVTVAIHWKDEKELKELKSALKSYLTYVIEEKINLGKIRWLDGYADAVPAEEDSRYVKAALYGIAGWAAGLFAGCLLAIFGAVWTDRVYELDMEGGIEGAEFSVLLPREGHREFRESCEMLAQQLADCQNGAPMWTVAWVPLGKQKLDTAARITASHLKEQGVNVKIIRITEEMQEKTAAAIEGILLEESPGERKQYQLKFIEFPDILKNRRLWYLLRRMDCSILAFQYGKSREQTLSYAAERSRQLRQFGCLWTEVSGSWLRRPVKAGKQCWEE